MYLSIIILPLLGSIVTGFFGRKIGVTGSRILSCISIIITTILAIISYLEVGFNNNPVSISLFPWLDSELFNMMWNFQFDSLTVSMLIPVLIISSLVHFYSIGYMSHDPHNQRFFSYLSLFTFMMIILVTGNNYLVMFVGWEGVGVCSYLLVSFWFTRIAANQSSLAAFLTNRVGDALLIIGMFMLLWSLGNLDYNVVFSLAPYINVNIITLIGICLLIGAMAKSSQVGLHIWLPMAMEGPTPVSALIHAATMVTAGVYLLIRSSPLIEYSSTVLLICLWLGAITTVFSSLIGLFQQDIKKIIAYSTMSQLGMMVIAIGLSSYNIAIFHLMNHAFYKGLLFLGAGAVIHAVNDNQDLRKYGGLISFLPLTYTVILIASLSLVAFPFMTGFYSKDFILESAYGQYFFSSINVYFIAVIGAIFTTLYSVKVIYLTFLTNPNGSVNYYKNAHEGDIFLSLPLVVLAIFSIYFGYITKDIYIGLGSGFFVDNSIFIHPIHEILINTEFGVPTLFKLMPFILTVLFSILAVVYPEFMGNTITNFKFTKLGYYIFGFFNQRFLIEFFYNNYIVNTVLSIGGKTTKILDKGSVEWIGPYGIWTVLNKISKSISIISKGVVTDYAVYILVSACTILSLFSFVDLNQDNLNINLLTFIIILINSGSYIVTKDENNNELKKYNKKITLEAAASKVYIIPSAAALLEYLPVLPTEYLPGNLVPSVDMKVLIVSGCLLLLSLICLVLFMKKGYRWWDPNQPPRPEPVVYVPNSAPQSDTDNVNRLAADIRNASKKEKEKLIISPILCEQFTQNHAKREEKSHNQFPAEDTKSHMTIAHIERFAAIFKDFPATCDIHVLYYADGGVVRYRSTNEPVRANSDIIRYVLGYEKSDGAWPRFNHLKAEMQKLEENDRINGGGRPPIA